MKIDDESQIENVIKKDLNRTFPTSKFFVEHGSGQAQLLRVLKAYAHYDREVGI